MIWIVASAFLFGLVHPGSKFIMQEGIALLPFCLLYVGVRFVAQVPLVLKSGAWKVHSRGQWITLLSLGFVGAALQYSEFAGVSDGLPVPIVTFLVYTHPVWTILLGRLINREAIAGDSLGKLLLSVAGVALITATQMVHSHPLISYLFPVGAGLLIALWITLSNSAAKRGCSSETISFYYDLFALGMLSALAFARGGTAFSEAAVFIMSPSRLAIVASYSILIGLLPNRLFYFGSRSVPAVTAGFILLLEPVIASLTSFAAWKDPLSPLFALGALCILSTNVPTERVAVFASSIRDFVFFSLEKYRKRVAWFSGLALLFFVGRALASTPERTLHVVEIVPLNSSDYNASGELRQIEIAMDLALRTYKGISPTCSVKVNKILKRGSDGELFETVRAISKSGDKAVLVGLSSTNATRIALKAAEGSTLTAISIGAANVDLQKTSRHFFSIVSPWGRQWEAVNQEMARKGCTAKDTVVVFDPKSVMSNNFGKKAREAGFTNILSLNDLKPEAFGKYLPDKHCAFIALGYAQAQRFISAITEKRWSGAVFGVGDWNYNAEELKKTVNLSGYPGLRLYAPTGWVPNATPRSRAFAEQFHKKALEEASPVAPYAYDGVLLALDRLCQENRSIEQSVRRLPMLRDYEGIAPTGNLLSKIFLIERQATGGESVQK